MSLSAAVIGAGPAGIYAAEALARHIDDIAIDITDRLPTPYGLVRAGVSPDHQSTKAVSRVLERTLKRDCIRLLGNVALGRYISLDELRNLYDIVILAQGAEEDRPLAIPGEDLPGVYGSMDVVGWYNAHPDYVRTRLQLETVRHVAVIGNGNVAIDVARVLNRTPEEMLTTDMPDYALDELRVSTIENTTILGRRGPLQAAFTQQEIAELQHMADADILVRAEQIPADAGGFPEKTRKAKEANLRILRQYTAPPQGAARQIRFEFFARPVAFLGEGRLQALRLERTRLHDGICEGTGEFFEIPCDMAVTCVGYRCVSLPGLVLDERGILNNEEGRIDKGFYAVGWAKRGPSGTIGANRSDSQDVVRTILAETGDLGGKPGGKALDTLLGQRGISVVDFEGWKRIEAAETAAAREGAPRRKLETIEEMIAIARGVP